ncbi:MAG: [FeFe] hydrogenase H-cluster maturation GTPase HydF [Bacteroidales bacterium]|nr:[FeFe] hydrogenase H-cluster maturation GTPase HydF [Bacteroidales bacterium]
MSRGKASKPHIGIFGRRNNGKSSIINTLAGQAVAIVSEIAGTTTDPVKKSIEIPGIGASVLVDTAGIDDSGDLGLKRIAKTKSVLKTIDLAILVIADNSFGEYEENLIVEFKNFDLPFFIIHNKNDMTLLSGKLKSELASKYKTEVIDFSALRPDNLEQVVECMQKLIPESAYKQASLLGDLLSCGDMVLLVTPIDIEAPEGRMILPQVQAIRDILDNDAIAVVLKERELDHYLRKMSPPPALVITDSQVFPKVDASVPKTIPLTSFSIMLARHKGDFDNYVKGTPHLSKLNDEDKILILESCTHHVSCDDIGRIKIPRWLDNFSGKKLHYQIVAGLDDLPEDIHNYALVIQCGGCMITRRQIANRLKPAIEAGVPVTNYGMAIAYVHGIYHRAIAPFIKDGIEKEDYL